MYGSKFTRVGERAMCALGQKVHVMLRSLQLAWYYPTYTVACSSYRDPGWTEMEVTTPNM